VAVNRRKTQNNQNPETDFFNITAWRALGENCSKYLTKGSKVCVVGPVSLRAFTRADGTAGASIEVTADDVEFLSTKSGDHNDNPSPQNPQVPEGFTQVYETPLF
jgi:single-strand DNA-binding protein